jgi:maltose/maltodextrin transport system substrate-binding protein
MKKFFLCLCALGLVPMHLFGWTNGELLIWMDPDRGHALKLLAQKFRDDLGINATIETPQNITDSFPLAAQVGKVPDIVVWAHDKVGEWADGGLIAPVEISAKYAHKFFPKAWQAVLHENRPWGYPIALEAVTLIYNRKLLDGYPPTDLSQLASVNQTIHQNILGQLPSSGITRVPTTPGGFWIARGVTFLRRRAQTTT